MKTVMVDLDDTIVAFSEMFVNKCNAIISRHFDFKKRMKVEDIKTYSFLYAFLNVYDKLTENHYYEMLNEIFSDTSFYDNAIYTNESHKIFELLYAYKNMGYKLILNTKVSTFEMSMTKINLFKRDKRFDLFDEIILDMERGEHSPKPHSYDMMIDDAPQNIENFLEHNKEGLVIMPLRPWNEKFKDNERVIIL